ncbi:MAG: flagellar biosynthetic protein FliO [Candidatus Omnitrophica bacterium]|nr:flagellar biosynthetic protein FliO [Candidatus Omnitrophota bacterium]
MVAASFRLIRAGLWLGLLSAFFFWMEAQASGQNPILAQDEIVSASFPAGASIAASSRIAFPSSDPVDEVFAAVQKHWGGDGSEDSTHRLDAEEADLSSDRDPSLMRSMGQMFISLAFVILLGLAAAWIFKRFFGKSYSLGGGYIVWLGSYALSQKSKIHLIRVGRQHFLVGEGANSISSISPVELETNEASAPEAMDDDSPDNPHDASPSFQNNLSQWQNSLESQDMRQEVNASLLVLKGLTRRLRSRRGADA